MSWNVFLKGKWIDRVWFIDVCDETYVRESLIYHDGYPYNITVKKGK